jgi:NAD(P)-dependent dehydrogenase (short-subunit alcohol dehydrogenase family)
MSSERKVVIVTGASQGIGADLVRAYRDRNYRVVAPEVHALLVAVRYLARPSPALHGSAIVERVTAEMAAVRPRPTAELFMAVA